MTHYITNLKKLSAWSSFAMLVLAICMPLRTAQAGEMVLKSRDVAHTTEETWIQIGEDETHGIGTYQLTGLSFLENGQVGTTVDKGSYESKMGSGPHQGYYKVTFSDGSGYMTKYQGATRPAGEKINAFEGTFTLVGGTGQFDGIKGEGTYTGKQYSNGVYVWDSEAKATVPN